MSGKSECKAKDPRLCRYHGALLVMDEAAKAGDVEKWLAARDEVAKAVRKKKIFHGEERVVPEMPSSFLAAPKDEEPVASKPARESVNLDDYDENGYSYYGKGRLSNNDLVKKLTRDGDRRLEERADYLRLSEAVHTPMEAYALWLSVWESQSNSRGRKLETVLNVPYVNKAAIFGKNNTSTGQGESIFNGDAPDYDDISWNRWTPTNGDMLIPSGYGSASLELFIMPDVVPQSLVSTSGDDRSGWEFGHTRVYILERDENSFSGYRASTNTSRVRSFVDVENYRRGKSIKQLAEALGRKNTFGKMTADDNKKELG